MARPSTLVALVFVCLLGVIAACGGDDAPAPSTQSASSATSEATTTPSPSTPSPSPTATPTPAPAGVSCPAAPAGTVKARFDQAGLTDASVTAATVPDPAKFATTFPTLARQVTAFVHLAADSEPAWVTACWKYHGTPISTRTFAANGAGWASPNLAPSLGLIDGDYEVSLAIVGTRESRSLPFTVGRAAAVSGVSIQDAGMAASFTVGGTAEPVFATSFKTGALPVLKMAGTAATAWVTETIRQKDTVLLTDSFEKPVGSWQTIDLGLLRQAPALGDYEVVLSVPGATGSRSLKFSLTSDNPPPVPKYEQLFLTNLGNGNSLCGIQTTTLAPTEIAAARMKFDRGSAARGLLTVRVTFLGLDVYSVATSIGAGASPIRLGSLPDGGAWMGLSLLAGTATRPLPAGAYDATLSVGGGESRRVSFEVRAPQQKPTTPARIEAAGAIQDWDGCTPPSNPPASGAVLTGRADVVYKLSDGAETELEWSGKKDGATLDLSKAGGGPGVTVVTVTPQPGAWSVIGIGGAGSYEITLAVPATGEKRTVTFTVR